MDPMTFSIIRHRLFRIVDEAVITPQTRLRLGHHERRA